MTSSQDGPNPPEHPATILVVDDNELNRDLLSRRLSKKGFEVALAEDAFEALSWLDDNYCDLVLLDIMMPGMSGVEMLEKIRQERDATELPIIMATAKDTREDIVGALQAGANDYVTKPIDFPVVLARVNAQLGLKQANDRVRALAAQLEKRNAFIRSVFGRYLTDDVAEALLDSPEGLALGGERREMSILMADIRGFTRMSAQRDPEEVVRIVNNFLSPMTEVVLRHGGTIDEFIGDAILVLFGAPRAMEDHAARAVACAIEMQLAMPSVNELNRRDGLPEVTTGIAINSGEVVVGNIGSERRAKYGVVGHNVNFTARIETETAGGQILVSDRTRSIIGSALQTGGGKTISPKGFDTDVRVHEVSGLGEPFNLRLP
jgi:adenylate cyclase